MKQRKVNQYICDFCGMKKYSKHATKMELRFLRGILQNLNSAQPYIYVHGHQKQLVFIGKAMFLLIILTFIMSLK